MKPHWVIMTFVVISAVFLAGCVSQQTSTENQTRSTNATTGVITSPPTSPVSSIQGQTWKLSTFMNGGIQSDVLPNSNVTAVFSDDGKLSGSTGCNSYLASYQLSGNRMKIGPVASTLIYCAEPAGVMNQETTYLGLLQNMTAYLTDVNQLKLFDGTGINQLTFKTAV